MKGTINAQELLDAFDNYCHNQCYYNGVNWCPECQFDEFKGIIEKMADPDKKTKPAFKVGDLVVIKKAFKPELKGQIGVIREVCIHGRGAYNQIAYFVLVRDEKDSKYIYAEDDLRFALDSDVIADARSYFRSRLAAVGVKGEEK